MSKEHGHDVPVRIGGGPQVHICTASDIDENVAGPEISNYWEPSPRAVVAYSVKGKFKVRVEDRSKERFDMYVKSLLCQAGAVDSDAELKAMLALKKRINDNQWDSYLLGNAFPETSTRSGVTYIFRKGLPTIAMRCVKRTDRPGEERNFLAALCSHPLGWYSGTHVGCYPPSDEVLANLLCMRADEHELWKKSHQHGINDTQAAI